MVGGTYRGGAPPGPAFGAGMFQLVFTGCLLEVEDEEGTEDVEEVLLEVEEALDVEDEDVEDEVEEVEVEGLCLCGAPPGPAFGAGMFQFELTGWRDVEDVDNVEGTAVVVSF